MSSPAPTHYPGRGLVLFAGALSILLSMGAILPSVLLLVNTNYWHYINNLWKKWLDTNHWTPEVIQVVWQFFAWVDQYHELILGSIIVSWVLHLLFSCLLLIGAMVHRRALLIPWLCTDMVILILMVVTFTSWTFLSFFVDLLVAIVFPVVGGLVLGLWIFLWRRVRSHHKLLGGGEAGYRPVLALQARPLPPIQEGRD